MSGGLAPSKSTVYVANLSYSLTNNDLHQIFKKYGKVVKVTIVKDKETHRSKGVAFVLFLERDGAYKCVRALDNTQLFGRTIKCSIAKDNGRAVEFIRRKEYKDKTRCYECGEFGHMSYSCPNNLLGEREPPEKKEKKRKRRHRQMDEEEEEEEQECESDEGEDPELESLSAAIRFQQEKVEEEEYRFKVATGQYDDTSVCKKKKYKKSAYFSDDEEIEDT